MSISRFFKKRTTLAAVAAGGGAIVLAAAGASLAAPALAASAGGSQQPAGSTTAVRLSLTPMPLGQVVVGAGTVTLSGYGFTPGSSHEVALSAFGFELPLGTVTASADGSVSWQYSAGHVAAMTKDHTGARDYPEARLHGARTGIRLVVLNAGQGTPVITRSPAITGLGRYRLEAVEPGFGAIKSGSATLVYNPAAKTISVTLTAAGLTPGDHAAHIHLGSCQDQGAVAYMFADFTANSRGVIWDETRTVTGVAAADLSGGWYFNLHQGNSGNILSSSGQPTINFRPLECADI